MNNQQVFATRSAAMMYLVAEGKPVNFVKAAINESYNYEPDQDVRDLLWGNDHTGGEMIPVVITAEEAIRAYNTMEEMFSVDHGTIYLDGEAAYDVFGDPIGSNPSIEQMIQLAAMQVATAIKGRFVGQENVTDFRAFALDFLAEEFRLEVMGELEM